jgi:hypothetical protein
MSMKLHLLVFTGEEAMGQPFLYHYTTDKDGRLPVCDGLER